MRYFLDQDNDCHWYLIAEECREDWNRWKELGPDDEMSWNSPLFASALGGHPNQISFTDPRS